VLGALSIVGLSLIGAVVGGNTVTAAYANSQLQSDINPVRDAINNYSANATACNNSLSCVTALDRRVAATLNTFAGQVQAISMPSGQASSADAALASSASHTASIFARLGAATSADQYISLANSSGLHQSLVQLNQDYLNLADVLTGR
jgi:hypothetical protein